MHVLDVLTLEQVAQGSILKLRSVNREIKYALETNVFLTIDIRLNDAGAEGMKASFLQRWRGGLNLYCTIQWTIESKWFKEMKDAIVLNQLRPPTLLSLSVEDINMLPLSKSLAEIGPAIQQIIIVYRGYTSEFLKAIDSITVLRGALIMEISIIGADVGGVQTAALLERLLASSIRLECISLRWTCLLRSHAFPSFRCHVTTTVPPLPPSPLKPSPCNHCEISGDQLSMH
jgi:hypothetical protein